MKRSRRHTDEAIPGSEREDTCKEVNEGNDEEADDDRATPTEDHHASCDREETEKRDSTCPELPKSKSVEHAKASSPTNGDRA